MAENAQDKLLVHPFEVRISIGGETWEYVRRAVQQIADHLSEREPAQAMLISGGAGRSYSVDVLNPNDRHGHMEAQANARLIAAAPEMLEALEDILKFGEHEGECDNDIADENRACSLHISACKRREERAKAAIRKAKGESDSHL